MTSACRRRTASSLALWPTLDGASRAFFPPRPFEQERISRAKSWTSRPIPPSTALAAALVSRHRVV
eukprot:9471883-Pyramimonas_sp.AAC.2